MTVTSLCVLSCKFFGGLAVHSSKQPPLPTPPRTHTPNPTTLKKKNQFHVSLELVFPSSVSLDSSRSVFVACKHAEDWRTAATETGRGTMFYTLFQRGKLLL